MMQASSTVCVRVNRNSRDSSSGTMLVAHAATAMLERLIILPITPPLELEAAIRTGLSPRREAVTTWRLPNSAFAEVSEPVRKTPIQPRIALKNGKDAPVAAKARPSVAVAPQQFI